MTVEGNLIKIQGREFDLLDELDNIPLVDSFVKNNKIGFGNGEYLTLPSTYSWQFGRKWHHLELGLGFTQMMIHPYYFYSRYEFYTYASQKIAYRFQSPKGGLFVRLSFLSMIDLLNVHVYTSAGPYSIQISSFRNVAGLDQPVFFWPGACLGFTFKK